MFSAAAWLITTFYGLVNNYAIAIALVAVVIMMIVFPLTLKSTKGMLEMQRLQPEMKRLQQQYRGDRQKLNEEMMKLYQEHKVNPLASCLPLIAQMPIFIIMFRALHGIADKVTCVSTGVGTFSPSVCQAAFNAGHPVTDGQQMLKLSYINTSSDMYQSLLGKDKMVSFGLDLAARPSQMIQENFGQGLIYVGLVVLLGGLYLVQQRMIASRTTAATMSPTQQKVMQYLPVFFAVFQLFFLLALVIYYITQTIVRIAQQFYITKRFYHGEHSLGRQAQAAGAKAREMAKEDGGGTGLRAALKEASGGGGKSDPPAKGGSKAGSSKSGSSSSGSKTADAGSASTSAPSKRVTPSKPKPTPNNATTPKGRPTPPSRSKPTPSSRPSRPKKP